MAESGSQTSFLYLEGRQYFCGPHHVSRVISSLTTGTAGDRPTNGNPTLQPAIHTLAWVFSGCSRRAWESHVSLPGDAIIMLWMPAFRAGSTWTVPLFVGGEPGDDVRRDEGGDATFVEATKSLWRVALRTGGRTT